MNGDMEQKRHAKPFRVILIDEGEKTVFVEGYDSIEAAQASAKDRNTRAKTLGLSGVYSAIVTPSVKVKSSAEQPS